MKSLLKLNLIRGLTQLNFHVHRRYCLIEIYDQDEKPL
jgi:hypothetical protein